MIALLRFPASRFLSFTRRALCKGQVAKVDPDLVARDGEGKPYTVRYEAVNAMLLNEFLKKHRKVEEQSNQIANIPAAGNASFSAPRAT
jgi:hypothetical protein